MLYSLSHEKRTIETASRDDRRARGLQALPGSAEGCLDGAQECAAPSPFGRAAAAKNTGNLEEQVTYYHPASLRVGGVVLFRWQRQTHSLLYSTFPIPRG